MGFDSSFIKEENERLVSEYQKLKQNGLYAEAHHFITELKNKYPHEPRFRQIYVHDTIVFLEKDGIEIPKMCKDLLFELCNELGSTAKRNCFLLGNDYPTSYNGINNSTRKDNRS